MGWVSSRAYYSYPAMHGNQHIVCIQASGTYYIANNNSLIWNGQFQWPDISLSSISCGYGAICALTTQGRIYCDGQYVDTFGADLPLGNKFVSVSLTRDGLSCAISHMSRPSCWGNFNDLSVYIPTIQAHQWRVLASTPSLVCGLHMDSSLWCYEAPNIKPSSQEWRRYANASISWVSLECNTDGTSYCCGLTVTGIARCWGDRDPASPPSVLDPPTHIQFARIWVGLICACGQSLNDTDTQLYCWGYLNGDRGEVVVPSPSPSMGINARTIIDMTCSWDHCLAILTDEGMAQTAREIRTGDGTAVIWPHYMYEYDDGRLHIDHYREVYRHGVNQKLLCASPIDDDHDDDPTQPSQKLDHGRWHCLHPSSVIMPPNDMINIATLSWSIDAAYGHYILLNGTVRGWLLQTIVHTTMLNHVPSPDQAFTAVCTNDDTTCAIRANGSLHCWTADAPHSPNAADPSSGGAIYNDYISIHCGRYSFCAMRSQGEVNCWGDVWNKDHFEAVQQPPVQPWKKMAAYQHSGYYGIYDGNNTLMTWAISSDLPPPSVPWPANTSMIDVALNGFNTRSCMCMIDHNGALICNACNSLLPSLSRLAAIDTITAGALNQSNHITSLGSYGICVTIHHQLTCYGPALARFRWGGYAMQPRQSLHRIIRIASDGIDAPFCGLRYFRACATINYAMTLAESSGPWIEYVFAAGVYDIYETITIDWTGVTIRGAVNATGALLTTWRFVDGRLTVAAPSFRLFTIIIESGKLGVDTAIVINSGLVDIVLDSCWFVQCETIEVATDSFLNIERCIFREPKSTAISITSGDLTLIASTFLCGTICAISSGLTIHSSIFDSCVFTQSVFSVTRGGLFMTSSMFRMTGSLLFTEQQAVWIIDCVFTQPDHGRGYGGGGGLIIRDGPTVAITACAFSQIYRGHTADEPVIAVTKAHVTITDSHFTRNGIAPFTKGLISCDNDGLRAYLILINVTSIGNIGTQGGGGVYGIGCTITIEGFVARDNQAIHRATANNDNGSDRDGVGDGDGVGVGAEQGWGHGAVFFLTQGSTASLTNVAFINNAAGIGGVAVMMASHMVFWGRSLWQDNTAVTLGSTIVVSIAGDYQYRPVFQDGPHIFINNTAPMGSPSSISDYVTEIARIALVTPLPLVAQLDGGPPIPTIMNHTSGMKLNTSLTWSAYDWYDHRFVTIPPYQQLTILIAARTAQQRIPEFAGILEKRLLDEATLREWLTNNYTLTFSDIIATAPPGVTRRYDCYWSVTTLQGGAWQSYYTFDIHYRGCVAGEETMELACDPCTTGRYSNNDTARSTNGTSSTNGMIMHCEPCARGHFQNTMGSSRCDTCPRGAFQSLTGQPNCFTCAAGTYSIDDGATDCAVCNNDESESDGLTCVTGGYVHVDYDHWASAIPYNTTLTDGTYVTNRRLVTKPCVRGRCIGGEYGTSSFKPCGENRLQWLNNTLCGHCLPDHTEIGSSCYKCQSPSAGMIVLLILISFILVAILHVMAQTKSGLPPIFFYWIQMSMLVLPPVSWLGWIGVFSGGITNATFGICLAPMTAGEEMVLSVCSIVLFWITLAMTGMAQVVLTRAYVPCYRTIRRLSYPIQRYWRSMISIYLFSYTTIANTLIGYLSCVDTHHDNGINDGTSDGTTTRSVIFIEPTISCDDDQYRMWLVIVIILLIITVILPPIVIMVYLTRNRMRFGEMIFINRWGNLYEPYNTGAYWWQSFILLRRVLITIVDITLVILPSFKFMIISSLHLLSLVIHVIIQPYITSRLNRMELLTLVSLTLLSLILATFPDTKDIERYSSVQMMILTIMLVPLAVFAIATILYIRYMIMKHGARLCCIITTNRSNNHHRGGGVINDHNVNNDEQDDDDPPHHNDDSDNNHGGAPLLTVHHQS